MELLVEEDHKTQVIHIYLINKIAHTGARRFYLLRNGEVTVREVPNGEIVEQDPALVAFLSMPLSFWEVIGKHFVEIAREMVRDEYSKLLSFPKELPASIQDDKYLKLLIDNQVMIIDKLLKTITTWQKLPTPWSSKRKVSSKKITQD